MFLIVGIRTRETTKETGTFICPACGCHRPYSKIHITKYFTVFFMPVLPVDTIKFVRCMHCVRDYMTSVLDNNRSSGSLAASKVESIYRYTPEPNGALESNRIPVGTQALIGASSKLPQLLFTTLVNTIRTHDLPIRLAYCNNVVFQLPGEKPHLAFVLDLTTDNDETLRYVCQMLGSISSEVMKSNDCVSFFTNNGNDFARDIINRTDPFYKKSFPN